MEINLSDTLTQLLQLSGQLLLPTAALLRALYAGLRGRLPDGAVQIVAASLFAGLTAIANNESFDLRTVAIDITSNTVFTAGVLSFIVVYLLRQPFRGLVVDGIVGGVASFVAWLVWTQVLGSDWPWWTAPLITAAGVAAFIGLRFGLRQLARLLRIATVLLVIGGLVALVALGALAVQTLGSQGGL
ncbi:MAG: hypothetical protein ACUVSX_13430 [Aggregatilineales bacterium]